MNAYTCVIEDGTASVIFVTLDWLKSCIPRCLAAAKNVLFAKPPTNFVTAGRQRPSARQQLGARSLIAVCSGEYCCDAMNTLCLRIKSMLLIRRRENARFSGHQNKRIRFHSIYILEVC